MKTNNMLSIWLTAISIFAGMASAATAYGQQAVAVPAAAQEGAVAVESFARRNGAWKVETGLVLIMETGKPSRQVGDGEATLGNAVKALSILYPDASFALDPRLTKVKVGDLLSRVEDPLSELKALRVASSGAFSIEASGKLFTLEPTHGGGGRNMARDERTVECFNLQGYLSHVVPQRSRTNGGSGAADFLAGPFEAAAVDKAIGRLRDVIHQAIQSVDPNLGQLDFQYFPEGQMLIATGPSQSLMIASRVIHALPGMNRSAGYSADQQRPAGGGGFGGAASPIERLFKHDDAPNQASPEAAGTDKIDPVKPEN